MNVPSVGSLIQGIAAGDQDSIDTVTAFDEHNACCEMSQVIAMVDMAVAGAMRIGGLGREGFLAMAASRWEEIHGCVGKALTARAIRRAAAAAKEQAP